MSLANSPPTFRPVFAEALIRHVDANVTAFHALPAAGEEAAQDSGVAALKRLTADFHAAKRYSTACTGGFLDSLHHPTGSIREAERLAALAFGADETSYLYNGSTGAIKTAWAEAVEPGDIVMTDAVHKAHLWAAVSAGAYVHTMAGTRVDALGLIGPVKHETVTADLLAFRRQGLLSRVKMIVLTHSIDGLVYDMAALARCVHQMAPHIILYADEAWIGHFSFASSYRPRTLMHAIAALQAEFPGLSGYASLSPHKGLLALFRGYGILNRRNRPVAERLKQWAKHSQISTSPCAAALAWADAAVMSAATEGEAQMARAEELAHAFAERVARFGVKAVTLQEMFPSNPDRTLQDPLKVTLALPAAISGRAFRDAMLQEGVHLSKVTPTSALCGFDLGKSRADLETLLHAVERVMRAVRGSSEPATAVPLPPPPVCHPAFQGPGGTLDIRKAYYRARRAEDVRLLSLKEMARLAAEGRPAVAAEIVTPYPPGVAAARFGEQVSAETCEYLLRLCRYRTEIHGVSDGPDEPCMHVFQEVALQA